MASIHEILLRVTGDADLEDEERDVEALRRELEQLDRTDAEAMVDVDTAAADAQLSALDKRLDRLDGRTVTVNVRIDEDQLGQLGALMGGGGGAGGLGGGSSGRSGGFFKKMLMLVPVLVPLVGALGAGLVSLGGSAVIGAGGLAALATGAAGLVPILGATVAGLVQNLKTMPKFANALTQLKGAFQRSTEGAARAALPGLEDGMAAIRGLLKDLEDDFTAVGKVLGQEARSWGQLLANPEWTAFWEMTADAVTRILPDLGAGLRSIATVLMRVATQAMPFLEAGAQAFREWAQGVEVASGDAHQLGGIVGTMVKHLQAVWAFFREIGRALGAILTGGEGEFLTFLNDINDAIAEWADWASSPEGQAAISETFSKLLPAAEALLGFMVDMVDAAIDFAEVMAPAVTLLADVFGPVGDAIDAIHGILKKLPDPIGAVLGAFLAWRSLVVAGGIFSKVLGYMKQIFGFGSKPVPTPVPTGTPAGGGTLKNAAKWAGRLVPPAIAFGAGWQIGSELQEGVDGWFEKNVRGQNEMGESWSDQIIAGAQDALNAAIPAVFAALPKRIRKAVDRAGGLREVFTDEQILEMGQSVAGGGQLAGTGYVKEFSRSIRARGGLLNDAIKAISGQAAKSIDTSGFKGAGRAIVEAVASGITAAGDALKGAMKKVGKKARDQLPGSEPRDPTSPLRGLDKAGRALIGNMVRGVVAEGPKLTRALADSAVMVQAPLRMPGRSGPTFGSMGATPYIGEQHNHFSTPGGSLPDGRAAEAALARDMRARGLVPG